MNEDGLSKIFGALKYLPASAGIKVLEKANPMFKNFFSKVSAYGLDSSRALDYLVDRFSNPKEFQRSLESRNPSQMRTDEIIAKNEINASLGPGKAVRNILGVAGGLAGALASPPIVQNQKVPEDLKALAEKTETAAQNVREAPFMAKINPENAESLAASAGQNVRTALSKQMAQSATGAANLISQYPELGKYLDQLIGNGLAPEQAALQAKSVKKFLPDIEAIERKVGDPFENIIAYLFSDRSIQKPTEMAQKSTGAISEALSMLRGLQAKIKGSRG